MVSHVKADIFVVHKSCAVSPTNLIIAMQYIKLYNFTLSIVHVQCTLYSTSMYNTALSLLSAANHCTVIYLLSLYYSTLLGTYNPALA